jgi:hypothetical protein
MAGVYRVTFRGTPATEPEIVTAYAYRRAAELCGGRDRFDVLEDEDISESKIVIPYRTVWPRRRLTVRCKGP